jgi:nucleolar protein 58
MQLNDILPEDVEQKVKEAAEVSMGTEISEEDLSNITNLCDQVIPRKNYQINKNIIYNSTINIGS